MRSAAIFLLVFSFTVCLHAQSDKTSAERSIPDSVFVSGTLKLKEGKPQSMLFAYWDSWRGTNHDDRAMIDEEGKFVIRIPLRNTSAVLWLCEGKKRRKGYIIVRPGDSLTMTINDTTVSFRGKNAQASEDYYHLRTENEWSQYVNALDTGYRLEPEEYLSFRKGHFSDDMKFLDAYCAKRKCSELFRQWYVADAKVRYFRDLMAYSWESRKYGLGSETRLTAERKERYDAAFMKDIDPDDGSYSMSYLYCPFVNAYSMRLDKNIPPDQVQKVLYVAKLNALLDIVSKEVSMEVSESGMYRKALENLLDNVNSNNVPDSADIKVLWKLSEKYELPLQHAMDKWNTDNTARRFASIPHQKTRELNILHNSIRWLESIPNLDYYYSVVSPLVETPEYKEVLRLEYEKQKEINDLVENGRPGVVIMKKDYARDADGLLSDVVKANQGKVILIDFWATWCGPCIENFTSIKACKEEIPDDKISYVYMCSQSSRDKWINLINRYDVKGTHYYISETQYDQFRRKFDFRAFPAYLVIDARNRIHQNISGADIRNPELFASKIRKIMR